MTGETNKGGNEQPRVGEWWWCLREGRAHHHRRQIYILDEKVWIKEGEKWGGSWKKGWVREMSEQSLEREKFIVLIISFYFIRKSIYSCAKYFLSLCNLKMKIFSHDFFSFLVFTLHVLLLLVMTTHLSLLLVMTIHLYSHWLWQLILMSHWSHQSLSSHMVIYLSALGNMLTSLINSTCSYLFII